MSWEIVLQLAALWVLICFMHPTINIHHSYTEPDEEKPHGHVGFRHKKEE